jgi:hypothetical protein
MTPMLFVICPLIRWTSQLRSLYLPHIGSAEICSVPIGCPAGRDNADLQGRSTALGTGTSRLQTYHSLRLALLNLYWFACRQLLSLCRCPPKCIHFNVRNVCLCSVSVFSVSTYRVGQTQLGRFWSLIANQSNNTRENGEVPFVVDRWQLPSSHFPVCCWIDWLLMIKNCLIESGPTCTFVTRVF